MATILVTGAAGFIGFHLAKQLSQRGDTVIGIDNINDYYDVNLKLARLAHLKQEENFTFIKLDLVDKNSIENLFKNYTFDCVVNLAAQAGVRYSLTNPDAYIQSNIVGFCHILECCRHHNVKNLVFASSSSVYGANNCQPFSEHHSTEHPLALYAASKKANEMMAHSYASLYNLPCTGLRFFTVYGPWGRPDMALFAFTKNILSDTPIDIYNNGKMIRDFTYVDDIVQGIILTIDNPAQPNNKWDHINPDPATSYAPYQIYNIGNNTPVNLMDFVEAIENYLGKKAIRNYAPMQPGDVPATFSDVSELAKLGYQPKTSITKGIAKFLDWYRTFYESKEPAFSSISM